MYKVMVVNPFGEHLLDLTLPTIPSVNDTITFWVNGKSKTEFDIKAVKFNTNKEFKFESVEICVEVAD